MNSITIQMIEGGSVDLKDSELNFEFNLHPFFPVVKVVKKDNTKNTNNENKQGVKQ